MGTPHKVISRPCRDCRTELIFAAQHPTNATLDLWFCVRCKELWPWLHNPLMDGSACQKHKLRDGSGFSGLSMLSDPDIKWKQTLKRRPR